MNTITYNAEIQFRTDVDRKYWSDLLEVSRQAYNRCSSILTINKIHLDLKAVHNAVYYTLRREFPTIPSQGIIKIYKDCIAAFRSINSNGHIKHKVPTKKNCSMRLEVHRVLVAHVVADRVGNLDAEHQGDTDDAYREDYLAERDFEIFGHFGALLEEVAGCVNRCIVLQVIETLDVISGNGKEQRSRECTYITLVFLDTLVVVLTDSGNLVLGELPTA